MAMVGTMEIKKKKFCLIMAVKEPWEEYGKS